MTGDAVGQVDPDIANFVRGIAQGYAEHASDTPRSMEERRRIAEAVREPWRTGGPVMARTETWEQDGVRLRLHLPVEEEGLPVLFYIHGGGWALFSMDTHDRLMREYAARSGVAVVGIDYSLSPEAKFPVALDEIVAALAWLEGEGAALGVDAWRMVVGGDSAGANLAVAACLRRRAAGEPALAGMLLNYGAFDPRRSRSYELYSGPEFTLEADEMDEFWRLYVAHEGQLEDPLVAPIEAELHGLPPAFLAIAECDILADSNRAFAQKLGEAGVPVESVVYQGATHSFLEAVSVAPLAGRALDDQARWLRARLGMAGDVG
jgi:acetyl esterase